MKLAATPDELRQSHVEEKQKTAAEESRRDMLAAKLPKWLEYITVFGDLRSATPLSALEEQMLEEVGDATQVGRLETRAALHPDADSDRGHPFERLGDDPQPVRQR